MNLLDVLKETNIIEAEPSVGDVVAGEEEKKRWQNMTSVERAKELRRREEEKAENKDKDKEWFDNFEKKALEIDKSKEAKLKAAQRAGGKAKAGTTSMARESREKSSKKADDIQKAEGRFYDMDYKDAIAEYDDVSKPERDQIIRRVAREVSKDKRNADNVLAELNKIESKEQVKIVKDAINDLLNPEGKGKHSQEALKKNVIDVSKKADKEADTDLKGKAQQIVTSWKGSGKEEEEALNKFIKDGENKKKAIGIIKNYFEGDSEDETDKLRNAIEKADDKQLKEMAKSLINLWKQDYVILQKFSKGAKTIEDDKVEKIIKEIEDKGRRNFEVVLNSINTVLNAIEKKKAEAKEKGIKAPDTTLSVEEVMKAIEDRKEQKNKMYQLFLDKGDTEAASKEAMKDQPKEEQRRWELMKKEKAGKLTDEERDELDKLQNEEFAPLFSKKDNLKYLKEGIGYKGVNFNKNYHASMILKTFIKDYNKHGDGVINFYEDTWGDWDGAFRLAANNIYTLQEEVESLNNQTLLFEALPDAIKAGVGSTPGLFQRTAMAVKGGRAGAVSGNILGRVWEKVKGMGKGFYENKLMPFLQSGFTWAKELATKGLDFFKNISPSVAIPIALSIAGVTSIAALRNRKKRKKVEQLLRKNENALAKVEGENEGLTKYLQQAKKLEKKVDGNTATDAA